MRIVFLTDGRNRVFRYGKSAIELRHATPRRMALANTISGLVYEALLHMGKEHVDEETVSTLRKVLTPEHKKRLFKDIGEFRTWMQPIIRQVTEDAA